MVADKNLAALALHADNDVPQESDVAPPIHLSTVPHPAKSTPRIMVKQRGLRFVEIPAAGYLDTDEEAGWRFRLLANPRANTSAP